MFKNEVLNHGIKKPRLLICFLHMTSSADNVSVEGDFHLYGVVVTTVAP